MKYIYKKTQIIASIKNKNIIKKIKENTNLSFFKNYKQYYNKLKNHKPQLR